MKTLRLWGNMYAALSADHPYVQKMLRDPQVASELFDPDAWTAIDYLLERPWWRQIWVIQEVALSKSAVLICGTEQRDWSSFCCAKLAWKIVSAPTFERYRSEDQSNMLGYTIIDAGDSIMLLQQLSMSNKRTPDLLELIRLTTKHLATDPRDMLYALLGMKDIINFGGMMVDVKYEHFFPQVYCNLVKSIVQYKHQLSILSGAGIAETPLPSHFHLPSWVPDLRNFSMREEYGQFVAAG